MDGLYDRDYHAWALAQAGQLRQLVEERSNVPLDLAHLAEEIEDLGNNELDVVEGNLAQVVSHLLKLEWSLQTEPRSHWRTEVDAHRANALRKLRRSPTLRSKIDLDGIWADGRRNALIALGSAQPSLPAGCPYSLDQLLDVSWWPQNRPGPE